MNFTILFSLLLTTSTAANDIQQPRQRQTLESNLQPSGESYQKCITNKCDKKLKDEKKTIECQQQCNTSYPDSTRSGTLKVVKLYIDYLPKQLHFFTDSFLLQCYLYTIVCALRVVLTMRKTVQERVQGQY
ncbi:hypothetical protein ACHAWO_011313 [Cyclotella atomus]|uniref:Uncharacterized protein n=1 Tax=Cyclotella atomus TaxID=382360 RepID=A0ABD3N3D1_9STRA